MWRKKKKKKKTSARGLQFRWVKIGLVPEVSVNALADTSEISIWVPPVPEN